MIRHVDVPDVPPLFVSTVYHKVCGALFIFAHWEAKAGADTNIAGDQDFPDCLGRLYCYSGFKPCPECWEWCIIPIELGHCFV